MRSGDKCSEVKVSSVEEENIDDDLLQLWPAVCNNYKQPAGVANDHPKVLDRDEVIIIIPSSLSKTL